MTNEQIQQIQSAVALQRAGRLAEAANIYSRVLAEVPDNFDCAYLLATLQAQRGHLDEAVALFRRAARMRPDVLDVQYNLAVALGMTGAHREAAKTYKRLLERSPQHAQARSNYAASLLSDGRGAEALAQYDALIAAHPAHADAYNNRGMALQFLKRFDEALRDYDKAVELRPDFPQAHVNRGNVLAALRRPDEALAGYQRAIALKPDFADAFSNAGNIYCLRRSFAEARAAYDRALALRPDDSEAAGMRLLARLNLCDWAGLDRDSADLVARIERGLPIYPFITLALPTSPAQQFRCATAFTAARYPPADKPLCGGKPYRHERLRIGYLSADFRTHAVAQLTAGLFEHHDRARFEITAISIGPDDKSDMRRRLESAFDHFIDAEAWRDDETAARIRAAEIDILVDLNGFTQGARFAILAQRPAPMQVGYLGYSGTTGAGYVDYLLADPIIVPRDEFACYSEKVVWLPGSFMVQDDNRPYPEQIPSRRELELPADGFVFCCFNQAYKISPAIFEVWMRLLLQVDGSVLWLKDNGAAPTENLRREAARRGIAPDRLVFAPSVPRTEDHLARHRQADLFLDTLPYNAHATTSDALWTGLPVITCRGATFAGRVAASQLEAVGLPELIAASLDDYEALALKFGRDRGALAALKAKLAANRATAALFDTRRFTAHLESAYAAMWESHRQGRKPQHLAVGALGA